MFNPLKIIGTIVKTVILPGVVQANSMPKGTTTGVGAVVAGAGIALGFGAGHILTDQNLVPAMEAAAKIIEAIGAIIIGIGAQRHHTDTVNSTPSQAQ